MISGTKHLNSRGERFLHEQGYSNIFLMTWIAWFYPIPGPIIQIIIFPFWKCDKWFQIEIPVNYNSSMWKKIMLSMLQIGQTKIF
jgi:hypothetical protein